METANLDGSITVYKIKDPSFDLCKGCNKVRFFFRLRRFQFLRSPSCFFVLLLHIRLKPVYLMLQETKDTCSFAQRNVYRYF